MNESFQFIDIIFFAMVAAFLVLRLRSVLGRRTGDERPKERQPTDAFGRPTERAGEKGETGDNVIELPDRRRTIPEGPQDRYAGTPVAAGLTEIRLADPDFDAQGFMEGAKAAFEIILGAYALGDVKTLKPLLNDEVLSNFAAAIEARRQAGEALESELVSIKSIDIVEAGLRDGKATVTAKVLSEQVNAVRDAEGAVIEGDPTRITEVVDLWTFARDVRSRDPNWQLIATATPDE